MLNVAENISLPGCHLLIERGRCNNIIEKFEARQPGPAR